MIKKAGKSFVNGILILAPVALTVWIVTKVFTILDSLTANLFNPEWAGERFASFFDFPGVGIILSLLLITAIGYLARVWLTRPLFSLVDRLLGSIPGVKIVYNLIKDTLSSFVGEKRSFSKVAAIRIPGTNMKLLGFITAEDCSHIGYPGYSSVYVMQSMQWAGNTVLVPREDVELVDVSAEEAMKFIVSAGIAGKANQK